MRLRLLLTAILFLLTLPAITIGAEKLFQIDFSQQPDGDATKWLADQGFEFLLDAKDLSLNFDNGRLRISTEDSIAGLVGMRFDEAGYLHHVDRVVIEWGVEKFPKGADWEAGNNRLAIGMLFILGTEKLSSGLPFGINAAPYFLGPFIGENEQPDKRYIGALYKEGGRYYCVANKKSAADVVTDFKLDKIYRKEFHKRTPPVTAFAFQVNTNDTRGGATSFIKRITFYSK